MSKINFKLFKKFAPSNCKWCGNKVYSGEAMHTRCVEIKYGLNRPKPIKEDVSE